MARAARRLKTSKDSVLAVALDSGFGDLSTFNARFRATFGTTPSKYRAHPSVLRGPERRGHHPLICATTPAMSPIPQCSTIRPSAMRKMSQEVNQSRLWLGSMP